MSIKSIVVLGKLWSDTHGNTYHTATVWVDGSPITSGITYGCGDHYLHTAHDLLAERGIIKSGGSLPLWIRCDDAGIAFNYEVVDVARQRNL